VTATCLTIDSTYDGNNKRDKIGAILALGINVERIVERRAIDQPSHESCHSSEHLRTQMLSSLAHHCQSQSARNQGMQEE
jgi:hypothetical protein